MNKSVEIAADPSAAESQTGSAAGTAMPILAGLSLCHMLNDMNQSLLPAIYPAVKESMGLTFAEIGIVTLAFQAVASLLQPLVGYATDHHPKPYSLSVGMLFTLAGLLTLSMADTYPVLLIAAMMVGIGSAVFHPESSRIARLASGGQHGLAQALFQVGGNVGSATGPLVAAFLLEGRGQGRIAWFAIAPLLASMILVWVGRWASHHTRAAKKRPAPPPTGLTKSRTYISLGVLVVLLISKYVYLASLSNYYTFFLIDSFQLTVQQAQLCLFAFLASVAVGTVAGGPIGDRIGRKTVIWVSILGVLPFSLALPWVGSLAGTVLLTMVIGLILSSAFGAIIVFGQELMPHRVATIAGLFFGLAFGIGGLGAAGLGWLADHTSIQLVYRTCAFLPALGIFAAFLPPIEQGRLRKS